MSNEQFDSGGNPLQPGALYAERTRGYFGEGVAHEYGRLLWFAGDGKFYDSDDEYGGAVSTHADSFVKQQGSFSQEFADFREVAHA